MNMDNSIYDDGDSWTQVISEFGLTTEARLAQLEADIRWYENQARECQETARRLREEHHTLCYGKETRTDETGQ